MEGDSPAEGEILMDDGMPADGDFPMDGELPDSQAGFGAGAAFAFRLLGGAETSGLFFPVPLLSSAPVSEGSSRARLFALAAAPSLSAGVCLTPRKLP